MSFSGIESDQDHGIMVSAEVDQSFVLCHSGLVFYTLLLTNFSKPDWLSVFRLALLCSYGFVFDHCSYTHVTTHLIHSVFEPKLESPHLYWPSLTFI